MAAGSPMGSSRMSTILGSRPDHIGLNLNLVQVDAVALRDLSGVDGVIRHGFEPIVLRPECDGVGVDLRVGLLRQHGHDARVEATGEEARHRDVSDQVRPSPSPRRPP